jgi:hypothetical protein
MNLVITKEDSALIHGRMLPYFSSNGRVKQSLMMGYADKTWCNDKSCLNFESCPTALTAKVRKKAIEWWGNEDAPILIYMDKLDCYEGEEIDPINRDKKNSETNS